MTSLPDYKRYVKTQYTIALNKNGGRCDKDARNAIGNGLWERVCVLSATEGASSVAKELHAKVRPRSSRRLATSPLVVEPERELGGRQDEGGLEGKQALCF